MTVPLLDAEDQLALVRNTTAELTGLLLSAPLDAPVPGCPDWDVRALVAHLGGVHAWARAALLAGDPSTPPEAPEDPAPADRALLVTWYAERRAEIVVALEDTGVERPCWGFGPPPRTAAFWWRRMAHESVLHLWDVRSALGEPRATLTVQPRVAADAVDEVVTMFVPRQLRLGRCDPLPAAVGLVATDVRGAAWQLGDGAEPDAVVRGPADVLALLLWRRTTLDDPRLDLSGDPAAAAAVLDRPLTP